MLSKNTYINLLVFLVLIFYFYSVGAQQRTYQIEHLTVENGLHHNQINSIIQDSLGFIWCATPYGLERYDGYEFKYFTVSDGLPNNYINTILAASDGSIWFGTEGGVARYYGSQITVYTEESGVGIAWVR